MNHSDCSHQKNSLKFDRSVLVPQALKIEEAIKLEPKLKKYLIKKGIDFRSKEALRLYNLLISREKYDLDLELPENALTPTPPLRFTFLKETIKPKSNILEIGTGASAIIALLAAKHFNAKAFATEKDSHLYKYAKINVKKNDLEDRVKIIPVEKNNVIKGVIREDIKFDAILSNPPWYKEKEIKGKAFSGEPAELSDQTLSSHIIKEGVEYLKKEGITALLLSIKHQQRIKKLENQMKKLKLKTTLIKLITGKRTRVILIGKRKI
ncbi:MAG: RlmF-related methyltransferase [Candidatus Wukongarchaeota archaeon]|nr:RlmF-related methyltransferase [Candidatus Wukongarchaeota archaeon]